ncbi:MAG: isocitrate/isopropylmalate family dehydrogenase [SAR202 cluster bacterium]|jgi:isocitrate/isopropylmalate dehydrogenase|nr:isocitrate/isopropylmalate family dehydrogenase [SAR202 cluster bacterium]
MVRIAVIPGDGISHEIMPEAVKTLETAHELYEFALDYETYDFGVEHYLKTGQVAPDDIDDFITGLPSTFDAALFGAGGIDPRVPSGESAQVVLRGLRRGLDLYANVRPCRLLNDDLTPLKGKTSDDIDFVVIRENTEGYESGTGGTFKVGTPLESEIRPEHNTYAGVRRVIEFAFDFAEQRGRKQVAVAEKGLPNGLWSRLFEVISAQHPDIESRHVHVDTMAYLMITAPELVDVVVAENRAGDILSDVGGAVQGSRGLAPAGCFNAEKDFAYFEPVHGTAPDIIGQGIANPMAAIMAAKMLLDYKGHPEAANAIEQAVRATIDSGTVTSDLGGSSSTAQVGEAVREALMKNAGR